MDYNLDINGHIGPWGFDRKYVADEMRKLSEESVNVRISSPGGSLDDALDIRQQFVDHGNVTAYIFGYTASAATVIAMGAKKVCMSRYAFFLVHKVMCWLDAWGRYNADEIDSLLEDLKQKKVENDKMDLVVAALYSRKCGKPIEDIVEVMRKGEWLTAQEALDYGFIDKIIEDGEIVNFDEYSHRYNMFDLPKPDGGKVRPERTTAAPAPSLDKLKQAVDRLCGTSEEPRGEAAADGPFLNEPVKDFYMNKEFTFVNAALQVEGVEEKDGMVCLSAEQLKTLDDRMQTLEKDLENEKEAKEELQKKVDNLSKADGDESRRVNGDEGASGMDDNALVNEIFKNFETLM